MCIRIWFLIWLLRMSIHAFEDLISHYSCIDFGRVMQTRQGSLLPSHFCKANKKNPEWKKRLSGNFIPIKSEYSISSLQFLRTLTPQFRNRDEDPKISLAWDELQSNKSHIINYHKQQTRNKQG